MAARAPPASIGCAMIALARVALVVVALVIADDAFVQPEPGTSAGDHLVSGLVPLALALALAWALPRIPVVPRGLLAIVAGALALTAGVADGIVAIAFGGPSGDDVVATAGALAGAALVVAGVAMLWRGRRRDGRRWARRAGLAVGCLVVAYLVVLPVAFAIVATHQPRRTVAARDLGRPYERITLTTADGLRLHGWYVPSRNRAAVITYPGRRGVVPAARMLAQHGYGVLLMDARGTGQSEGDPNAFGWHGERDVRAALGWLEHRADVDRARIGGLGLSVGGEVLLQTAARTDALRAVVSEGAGRRSMAEQLDWPGIPAWQRWISPMLVQTGATAVLAPASPPPGLTGLARDLPPSRVLLIRALDGNPDEVLNRVYAPAAGATLWEVADGGHTGALRAHPAEYERRVIGFFDAALRPAPSSGMLRQ
jgi:predicted alpha/beta hydrolase